DKLTWNERLTINAGVRYDRTSTWLPAQGNPGIGPFATKTVLPANHNFPVYNSWVPRFSVVYNVTGNGRLALKAGYGRYATAGPGAAVVNPTVPTVATYNNWDGTIPYVPQPQDLASRSVVSGVTGVTGGGGTQNLAPNLKVGLMDEYSSGIDLGFSRDTVL